MVDLLIQIVEPEFNRFDTEVVAGEHDIAVGLVLALATDLVGPRSAGEGHKEVSSLLCIRFTKDRASALLKLMGIFRVFHK